MIPSSRTPEGEPNLCPICGNAVRIEPSSDSRDAPCPHCGSLLWFFSESNDEGRLPDVSSVIQKACEAMAQGERSTPTPLPQRQKTRQAVSAGISQPTIGLDVARLGLCVQIDPADIRYVRAFLLALRTKYKNNRKGATFARFRARRARRALERARRSRDWQAVVRTGVEVLSVNPWDVSALQAMASAAKADGNTDCEFHFLRCALEAAPKDIDTNIQCADALAARGQVDQAIACWHRVEQLRPGDKRALRAISELTVRKSLKSGE
jgi:hypothetical protein